jgi:hypothetical protein
MQEVLWDLLSKELLASLLDIKLSVHPILLSRRPGGDYAISGPT